MGGRGKTGLCDAGFQPGGADGKEKSREGHRPEGESPEQNELGQRNGRTISFLNSPKKRATKRVSVWPFADT